jgi:hypothetical protein
MASPANTTYSSSVDARKEVTQFKALYNGIGKKAARKMAKTAMQEVLVVEGTEGK